MLDQHRLRRIVLAGALAGTIGGGAAVLSVTSAAAASAANKITNCTKSATKPASVTIACGDGGIFLSGLKWSSFGGSTASATGALKINNCDPNCAGGKVSSYPAKVKALDPKVCKGGVRDYTVVELSYTTSARPPKSDPTRFPLGCPL
jgi:hypothetical protein